MKRFHCPNCSNELYFDSRSCESCGKRTAYDPSAFTFVTLAQDATGALKPDGGDERYLCRNAGQDACNWLVTDGNGSGLCLSCRHTRVIPDLSIAVNQTHWRTLELAKRQIFYSLLRWHLPAPTQAENAASGLAFDFLADTVNADGSITRVLTGHEGGIITINVAEADDAMREKARTEMREPYRTLLGHYRHEMGHYYWDRLVRDGGKLDDFRQLFGDESADYAAALKRNYELGPPAGWQGVYISAYASVHPWEDFAETWAHYLHIVDSLETATAYGMSLCATSTGEGGSFKPYEARSFKTVLESWVPFTLAMNSINRSMGQRDFYPFVIGEPVAHKLDFVHRLIHPQTAN